MNAANSTMQPSAGKRQHPVVDLQGVARQGMAELILFLLVSTFFFCCRHADLLAPLTESARQLLGCPPPPALTTLAMTGYTISAAILIVHRAAGGERPVLKWSHLLLRSVFYLFHAFGGTLPTHFMGVFIGGLLLFVLEQLNIWTYSQKVLPGGRAAFGKF